MIEYITMPEFKVCHYYYTCAHFICNPCHVQKAARADADSTTEVDQELEPPPLPAPYSIATDDAMDNKGFTVNPALSES